MTLGRFRLSLLAGARAMLIRRAAFRWGAGWVIVVGLSTTIPGSARYSGISLSNEGYSDCRSCHTGTTYPTVSLHSYSGSEQSPPSWVAVGSSTHLHLKVVRATTTHVRAGFNAWASAGSLSTTTGQYNAGVRTITGASNQEVTHTEPKVVTSGGTYHFGFDFDAPVTPGNVIITAWGNAVNNDIMAYTVDDSASGTSTTIAVCKDADSDGNYVGPAACPGNANDDCDDDDPNNEYGGTETCDGQDNDCDTSVDEGVKTRFYQDADGDGYGDITTFVDACSNPGGWVTGVTTANDDCNDNASTGAAINPGASEICNLVDDNCDGSIDEGVKTTFYRDRDVDGQGDLTTTTAACTAPGGYVANSLDCDDFCVTCYDGGTEVCDGEDNDCDSSFDEPSAVDAPTWYHDGDVDGYGDPGDSQKACSQPVGYIANNTDCDDGDSARRPGHAELCDDKDNDCTGATAVDVGCNDDGDPYCDASMTVVGTPAICPSGWGDCDDADDVRYPGNAEICDNKDNDCAGATAIDVGCDDDNDGYCDENMAFSGSPSTCPGGSGDCDDDCITCFPGNAEACDNEDNNCDGTADENITAVTCGYGICQQMASGCTNGVPDSCTPLSPGTETCGNVGTDDDCDADVNEVGHLSDSSPIYEGDPGCNSGLPGVCASGIYTCNGSTLECDPIISVGSQAEICDNLDNDCDGAIDEGCDDDNDGYCEAGLTIVGTPTTCILGNGDCNDTPGAGASVNPGAAESCSNLGVDNDCDGNDQELVDGVTTLTGCTGAAPGICSDGTYTCSAGSLVCVPTIPVGSQTEVCDGLDNDCDGPADNGLPDLTCGTGQCANTVPACDGGFPNTCTEFSSSAEICDDVDNDCNGDVDDGCDDDDDGYCDVSMDISGIPAICPNGGGDCNDAADVTNPGAGELCDAADNDCDGDTDEAEDISLAECGKGICKRTGTTCELDSCTPGMAEIEICDDLDNDCDGEVDNGCDDDGDGYCDAGMAIEGSPAVCSLGVDDCDDEALETSPGASEVCDLEDNDCDGDADEEAELELATCGVGACVRTGTSCDPSDCTPGTALPEICDGIDNDCNTQIDDGMPLAVCGEGACQTTGSTCHPSTCVPLDPLPEVCDGVDNDCDGIIDDGCDDDGDGFCDFNLTFVSTPFCPLGGGDCNDLSAESHPGALELCDDDDNDCNGEIDDDVLEATCGVGACQAVGTSCGPGGIAVDCTPNSPSEEVCDGLDNDCNGIIDDGLVEVSCGVGQCLVVIPGCGDGEEVTCEPLEPQEEICDGLDNNCNSHIDDDAFCTNGLCVGGRCVTADDLGIGGSGSFPEDYDPEDVERWLEGTAGAAQGGASSLDPDDYKVRRSADRGSCSVGTPGASERGSYAWWMLFGLGSWIARRRMIGVARRRSAA